MHFLLSSNCSYLNYVQSCDACVVGAVTAHVLHGNFSLETSAVWLHSGGERIITFLWVVFLGSWGRMCIAWFWVMVYVLKVFLWTEQLDTWSNQTKHIFQGICVNIFLQSIFTECFKSLRPCGHLLSPFLDTTFDRDSGSWGRQLPETFWRPCDWFVFRGVFWSSILAVLKLSITNYLRA